MEKKNILKKAPGVVKKKIEEYFKQCDPHIEEVLVVDYKQNPAGDRRKLITKTRQRPYTISGVANVLDITTKLFRDLSNPDIPVKRAKVRVSPGVKKVLVWALQQVEEYAEKSLYSGRGPGAQFVLKNIGDWKDKSEVEASGLPESILSLEKAISKALTKK